MQNTGSENRPLEALHGLSPSLNLKTTMQTSLDSLLEGESEDSHPRRSHPVLVIPWAIHHQLTVSAQVSLAWPRPEELLTHLGVKQLAVVGP